MSKTTTRKAAAAEVTRLEAYGVRDYNDANGEPKTQWTRLGVAFPHADGNGFNVVLRAIPLDGKLVLRIYEPKNESAD